MDIDIRVPKFDSSLGVIRLVDSDGEVKEYNPADIVGFDQNNYQEEFTKQASKYSWWSSVFMYQKRVLSGESYKLDQVHATLYSYYNNALSSNSNKRPTKDVIEASVITDEKYVNQKNIVENEEYTVGVLQSLVKSLEQRKDMLIQYGAEMRADRNIGN